jgi:hypothetical protein
MVAIMKRPLKTPESIKGQSNLSLCLHSLLTHFLQRGRSLGSPESFRWAMEAKQLSRLSNPMVIRTKPSGATIVTNTYAAL